jgi:putative CocE/NonD family hydrolase
MMRLMYATARRELLEVPMPDGVRLATSVSLPKSDFRGPALLLRSPYPFLSFAEATLGLELAEVLAAGFAVVRQDVRGRGGSGGSFGFLGQEGSDGRATVAWMTRQPWCDGRLGTVGGSYMGRAQLMLGQAPPGLRAMIPALTGLRSEPTWWPGGALNLALTATWMLQLLEGRPRSLTAAEIATVRALCDTQDPAGAVAAALDETHPAHRLMEPVIRLVRGERDPQLDAPVPTVPTLHITGWYDQAAAGTIDGWREARERDDPASHHLIVGPWTHEDFNGQLHGRRHPGGDAASWGLAIQQMDFLSLHIHGTGQPLPIVQVYVTGADTWRTYGAWPPPADLHVLYLGGVDHSLRPMAPDAVAQWAITSRAGGPVPSIGGPCSSFALSTGITSQVGPADASALLGRDDVLVMRSQPFPTDVEVAGTIHVVLRASTDVPPLGLMAKLVEATSDGRWRVVTDGVAVAGDPRHHELQLDIELSPIHHRFATGTQIALLLMATESPRYAVGLDADRVVHIHTGGRSAARLVLPAVRG